MLHLLINHDDGLWPAFMGAYAATLAEVQIRFEEAVGCFMDAAFRTEEITDTAFDTFSFIQNGTLGSPTARFIRTGASRFKDDTSGVHFLPGFRPYFLFHRNTSTILFTLPF
jgi:hypothetical protein